MAELRVSLMGDFIPETLQAALREFETQQRVRLHLDLIPWSTAWEKMVQVALDDDGPDVSEIGTTWISSFISMNTLRPFAGYELALLGNMHDFLPAAWECGTFPDRFGQKATWAIPWGTDTRLIYYRRDLLEKAGIDAATAFQSHERMIHTLQRLTQSGVATPLALVNEPGYAFTIQVLASWVWGAGGDFVSADGKRLLLAEPEGRAGLRAYFDLSRFLSPAARNLGSGQDARLFQSGEAAVVFNGHWMIEVARNPPTLPAVTVNLGVAPMPGVPFVGGSSLVIWQRCRRTSEAMALIRFLTSQRVQANCLLPTALLLPARIHALEIPPFTTDPAYQAVAESLRKGRGFRAPYMWGLVEKELRVVVSELWAAIFTDPSLDLESVIDERLEKLARRLDQILAR